MPIVTYLAMTAAEYHFATDAPMAWMSCLFSPYGTGITNLPNSLPPDSLLILGDLIGVDGHDPIRVAGQLEECVSRLGCCGVLLDFQRPDSGETQAMATTLAALPFPVGVSEPYARMLSCPVFLPPCPPEQTLENYLSHWQGRELWMEIATERSRICVTENRAEFSRFVDTGAPLPHYDSELCCHFHQEFSDESAIFTLGRNRDDIGALLIRAEALGVSKAIGLSQEFS